MDLETLKTFGQYAGIGGLALAVFLLISRGVLQKQMLTLIGKAQAYRLMTLATVLAWSVAVSGVGAWLIVETGVASSASSTGVPAIETSSGTAGADCSIKVDQGVAACRDAAVRDFKIER